MNNLTLYTINYNDNNLLNKIFYWRNDETTRSFSLNKNIITDEIFQHIICKYKESEIQPLILCNNLDEIGIYTFINKDNKIFIGINIDPNYRGKGIGTISLLMVLDYIKQNYNNIKNIYAQINKENNKSISLFRKYFKLFEENNEFNIYIYEFY